MTLRVLDLFSGLGGATSAFRDRGHEVVGVEKDPEIAEKADDGSWHELLVQDVRRVARHWEVLNEQCGPFDLVWTSPPCQPFGRLAIRHYWNGDGTPGDPRTWEGIALVYRTIALIQRLDPIAFVIENPAGMLRNLDPMQAFDRETVTYCQYGHALRKPTDLWGGFPPALDLAPPCSPGADCHGSDPNNQQSYGADSTAGVPQEWQRDENNNLPQDRLARAKRALVPYELSLELCEAMEAFDGHWRDHSEREQYEQQRLPGVAP